MGEKGLVAQLGLVLELDPVTVLMVPHCMLEDHNLQHLLHLIVGKPTAVDKCGYPGNERVDAFIGALAHI